MITCDSWMKYISVRGGPTTNPVDYHPWLTHSISLKNRFCIRCVPCTPVPIPSGLFVFISQQFNIFKLGTQSVLHPMCPNLISSQTLHTYTFLAFESSAQAPCMPTKSSENFTPARTLPHAVNAITEHRILSSLDIQGFSFKDQRN